MDCDTHADVENLAGCPKIGALGAAQRDDLWFSCLHTAQMPVATIRRIFRSWMSLSLIHANQRINLLAGGDVVRGSCDFLATQDGLLGSAISQTG
jgi:hypothetical protein